MLLGLDACLTCLGFAEREEPADLVPKLQAIAQNDQDRRIFVRGDKDLAYGRIMEVMGTITQGGFTKVALLAEQPAPQPAAAAPTGATPTGTAPPATAPTGTGRPKSG